MIASKRANISRLATVWEKKRNSSAQNQPVFMIFLVANIVRAAIIITKLITMAVESIGLLGSKNTKPQPKT